MSKEIAPTDLIINLPAVMTAETFTNDEEFDKLYSQVKDAVAKHVPDTTTKGGRDAIASVAYKVARTKTALVAHGKKLTETWRDQTKKVNAACNTIEERLDALKDEVRKPLTEWEVSEAARLDGHKARLENLLAYSKIGFGRPSSEIRELLSEAKKITTGKDVWDEFAPQAGVASADAIDTLNCLLATAEKQEREAAELEQLRAEKAGRDRLEAERLAAEAEASAEAERIERERLAEERRKEEIALAAAEAADRAEREAEAKIEAAKRAAAEAEERHAVAMRASEEARLRDVAAAKAQAEHDAEAERKRIADAQAVEAAEQKRRDDDKAHRKAINMAIVTELVECAGITTDQAQKIVVHMVIGLVPNVTLRY